MAGGSTAGPFGAWLQGYLRGGAVPCGSCNACCRASYFVHIQADEVETLRRIPRKYLVRAPRPREQDAVMDQSAAGRCPMLCGEACSIYQHRPQTCRDYDCRAFAAAGISLGTGPRNAINERIWQWHFEYPTELDAQLHAAVRAAASFLRTRSESLPAELRPADPKELARAAVGVHALFLRPEAASDEALVSAVVRRLEQLAGEGSARLRQERRGERDEAAHARAEGHCGVRSEAARVQRG